MQQVLKNESFILNLIDILAHDIFWDYQKGSKAKISVWNNFSWLSIQYWRATSLRWDRFISFFVSKNTTVTVFCRRNDSSAIHRPEFKMLKNNFEKTFWMAVSRILIRIFYSISWTFHLWTGNRDNSHCRSVTTEPDPK